VNHGTLRTSSTPPHRTIAFTFSISSFFIMQKNEIEKVKAKGQVVKMK
jgi:hypothetical protein